MTIYTKRDDKGKIQKKYILTKYDFSPINKWQVTVVTLNKKEPGVGSKYFKTRSEAVNYIKKRI